MSRRFWPALELEILRVVFPHHSTQTIAEAFGRSACSVNGAAHKLGVKKSEAYLASADACRLRRGDNVGASYRFKPGHTTWNRGKKLGSKWTRGRMAQTQFKKGQVPHTWRPIGATRFSKEGYLQRKVSDTGYPPRDWKGVHILLWEEKHGPVPQGYVVAVKDGDRTRIVEDNLELVSRAEMMRRNTIHNLPEQLVSVIMLNGALKRKLRRLNEEHAGGSAQPSLRDDRKTQGRRETDGDRAGARG